MDYLIYAGSFAVATAIAYALTYLYTKKSTFPPEFWKVFIPTLFVMPVYWLVRDIAGIKYSLDSPLFWVKHEEIVCIGILVLVGLILWRLVPGYYKEITVANSFVAVIGAFVFFVLSLLFVAIVIVFARPY